MTTYNDKWTLERVYVYARGYYDGRSIGVSEFPFEDDTLRHYYNVGYDRGVTDFVYIDENEQDKECE